MTRDKTPEDILGEYTDDLLTDRRPRLPEEMASLGEADRADVGGLAALVRQLKAAHTKPPSPTEDFLARLDTAVAAEIVARGKAHATEPGAATRPQPSHRLGRDMLDGIAAFLAGWRWHLAGCAAVAVLLALQVQVVIQVKALQQENRDLGSRLERLATPDRMAPLSLPAEIALRLRIEQRIEELERERAAKTGDERRAVERAIQELRALLRAGKDK